MYNIKIHSSIFDKSVTYKKCRSKVQTLEELDKLIKKTKIIGIYETDMKAGSRDYIVFVI
jgi:hypothetical protein